MVPKTLDKQWVAFLQDEFNQPYFIKIIQHYKKALANNQCIFPPNYLIFNAFNLTPLENIKVVILGQDPYHGSIIVDNREIPQAMGLSFSVPQGVPIPPSLKNIYKELEQDLGLKMPNHGDLTSWAKRGVLLLNSILSVQKNIAGSHKDFGWEQFSDAVIVKISENLCNIVFLLWGNYAKKKENLIDTTKHCVITAPHPSPLARGFVGSKVFSQANQALMRYGREPMDWSL
ncbi:uracil-DNA glycosylase [Helicobacter didelphidarum]|uniref:Uracil-DNA glycosylase n=1 Tax=Helicobacter didelphidarum TaxID=2040648 RepID=A0A3D8IMD4_9HELI|nr:uracil-DNA glycosylase [Helicobacter didelphidarum]RDU66086.1 uracil-DNA glycosylase [Helicobacter didelphidarum]